MEQILSTNPSEKELQKPFGTGVSPKQSTKLNSRSTAEEYKRIEAEIRKQRANGYSLEQKKERASLVSGNIEQLRQVSLNLADTGEILAKEI